MKGKILAFALFLFAVIATYGCDGGGSNPAEPSTNPDWERLIIGKWERQSGYALFDFEQFNADRSYTFRDFSGEGTGTWKIESNRLIINAGRKYIDLWREIVSISQTEMRLRENSAKREETVYRRIS